MESGFLLGALLASALGVIADVRSARIPNWLTGGALVAALLVRTFLAGWSAAAAGLAGAGIAGGVLFLPFVARGMGGGDVKLMAAVGAWVGVGHVLALIMSTAIAGGILALFYIAIHRRISATIWRVGQRLRFHLVSGIVPHPDVEASSASSLRLPYSLAIAAGALFVLISSSMPVGR